MSKLIIDGDGQYDFTALAEAVYKTVKQRTSLKAEIIFVSEDEIKKLNAEKRNTDKVTDVLSFPSLDNIKGKKIYKKDFSFDLDGEGNVFIGSVAICEGVAKKQAEDYGHTKEREVFYLAAHGLLHLLGYDHMDEEEKEEMRKKEEEIMKKIGLERENI